jgi:hypothetical protein
MNQSPVSRKKAVKRARRSGIQDALPDVQPPNEVKRMSDKAEDKDDDED